MAWETPLLDCVVEDDKNIQNVSNSLDRMAVLSNTLLRSEAPISLRFLCFHPPLLLCTPKRKTTMLPRLCIEKGSSRDNSCIVSPLKRQTPPSFVNYNFEFHANWLNGNFSEIIIIIWWHHLRFSNKDHSWWIIGTNPVVTFLCVSLHSKNNWTVCLIV